MLITVMTMLSAQTQMEALHVLACLVLREMELRVQVCKLS